jgi:hypothetical protein
MSIVLTSFLEKQLSQPVAFGFLGLPFPVSAHLPKGIDRHLAHEDPATVLKWFRPR